VLAADVNSLTSPETELPFEYYSLPFCKPPEGVRSTLSAINPGTILTGARIENSPYNFTTMVRSPTATACSAGRSAPGFSAWSALCMPTAQDLASGH